MHAFRRWLLVLAALVAGCASLTAKTLTFDAEKCQVDVPDSWTSKNLPGFNALYASPGQTKSMVLKIDKATANLTLDNPQFIRGFESSVQSHGGTITNRQHLLLGGVNAYVVDINMPAPAGTIYGRMYLTIANGYAYALDISQLSAMPYDDDELKAIVASFAFIGTPEVPKEKTAAEKAGYAAGRIVGVLFALIALRWIVLP